MTIAYCPWYTGWNNSRTLQDDILGSWPGCELHGAQDPLELLDVCKRNQIYQPESFIWKPYKLERVP